MFYLCEFCIRHGEGKKWYEVMENYSMELYSQKNREKFAKEFVKNSQTTMLPQIEMMTSLKKTKPALYRSYRSIGTWYMKQNHFGQVIPLEDAERVLDMAHSITRIPCVCRSAVKGEKNARYCFALGMDPMGIFGDYPDLRANLEVLSPNEAKKLIKQFDHEGLIHSIWTFKTPFIGALCNCDRDCMAYKTQVTADLMQVMFKAEYVARVEKLDCVGCRNCMKLCQFGAVEYSSLERKCSINPLKCYGCGVCRSACHKNAIVLDSH